MFCFFKCRRKQQAEFVQRTLDEVAEKVRVIEKLEARIKELEAAYDKLFAANQQNLYENSELRMDLATLSLFAEDVMAATETAEAKGLVSVLARRKVPAKGE